MAEIRARMQGLRPGSAARDAENAAARHPAARGAMLPRAGESALESEAAAREAREWLGGEEGLYTHLQGGYASMSLRGQGGRVQRIFTPRPTQAGGDEVAMRSAPETADGWAGRGETRSITEQSNTMAAATPGFQARMTQEQESHPPTPLPSLLRTAADQLQSKIRAIFPTGDGS